MSIPKPRVVYPVGQRSWKQRALAGLLGATMFLQALPMNALASNLSQVIPVVDPVTAEAMDTMRVPSLDRVIQERRGVSDPMLSWAFLKQKISEGGTLAANETMSPNMSIQPPLMVDRPSDTFVPVTSPLSSPVVSAVVNQNIPFVELGRLDSRPGEAKDAFLLRVGQVLNVFTLQTRHEACAAIMTKQDGSAWRVRLTTNRSQLACVRMVPTEVDYVYSGETIHSHPQPKKHEGFLRVRANAMDGRLRGAFCGDRVQVDDHRFSDGDKSNGSGYLVTRGILLYLTKDGVTQTVGTIDTTAPLPPLVADGAWDVDQSSLMASVQTAPTLTPPSLKQALAQQAWTRTDSQGLPQTTCPVFK